MDLEIITSELQGMIGSTVRFWNYTASHDRLTLKVIDPSKPILLECVFCEKISAPIFWRLENPVVKKYDDNRIAFIDKEVEIICQEIGQFEDLDNRVLR